MTTYDLLEEEFRNRSPHWLSFHGRHPDRAEAIRAKVMARRHARLLAAQKRADDANWDEAKHPRGQPANSGQFASVPGGGASALNKSPTKESSVAFISPNIGNLNFEQAIDETHKRRHHQTALAFHDIDTMLKLKSHAATVIGAWADGAENSIMTAVKGASWDQLRTSAAMKGYIAAQKQVLAFEPGTDDSGDAFLAHFHATGSLSEIHDYLLQAKLPFHTLEPTAHGAIVHLYGEDKDTAAAAMEAGKHYGGETEFRHGRGEFIGTTKEDGTDREQREDARKIYEEYIGKLGGEDVAAGWNELRDRYAGAKSKEKLGTQLAGKGYSSEAKLDDHGVIHTGNVYDAARALFEHRDVELKQADQVATLIQHLGKITQKMIKMGGTAPNFNLCQVSLKGSNLFCAKSKGIPRIEMPQLDEKQSKEFRHWLKARGYGIEKDTVKASHLRATQNELIAAKIAKAVNFLRDTKPGDLPRLLVSKDNYILDGHHRWAAEIGLDAENGKIGDIQMRVAKIDTDIITLLKLADEFTGGKGKRGMQDSATDADCDDGGCTLHGYYADAAATWHEEDHPRGQPENAGEFSSTSGGGGSDDDHNTSHGFDIAGTERDARAGVAAGAKTATRASLEGNRGHPATIASRLPTSKKVGDLADREYLRPDLATMRTKKNFEKDIALLDDAKHYPQLKLTGSADAKARQAIAVFKKNLKTLIETAPASLTEPAKIWYDGARKLVDQRAKKYGYRDAAAAGVYAALSPQLDWNKNVYLGDCIMDAWATQQTHKFDDTMAAAIPAALKANADLAPALAAVQGKTLGECSSNIERALWTRIYDEAHSDRSYRIVRPDGTLGDYATNKPNKHGHAAKSKTTWVATDAVAHAYNILLADGDRKVVSDTLGEKHKVRSFYNNILDPHSENGDVTVDTHAVGVALLIPSSQMDVPVLHNFDTSSKKPIPSFKSPGSAKDLGISGTYPLYAEAYRELAHEMHLEPRQVQSMAWEAKKWLFHSVSPKDKLAVNDLWQAYHRGDASFGETQKKVIEYGREHCR